MAIKKRCGRLPFSTLHTRFFMICFIGRNNKTPNNAGGDRFIPNRQATDLDNIAFKAKQVGHSFTDCP